MKHLKTILPLLLGLFFVFSAITKLLSVSYFDLYIYSLKFFSLKLSILLSRFTIALELLIGIAFLLKIRPKTNIYISIIMLAAFTIFIAYSEISGISNDCHCFGDVLKISNLWSIVKNLAIVSLLLLLLKFDPQSTQKSPNLKLTTAIVVALLMSFAVNFPFNSLFHNSNNRYCEPCLDEFIAKNEFVNNKRMYCFLSTKCKYCHLAAEKISIIAKKSQHPDRIVYAFWDNNDTAENFDKFSPVNNFAFMKLDVLTFMELTQGKMPLIILHDGEKVLKTFRYNDIDEDAILDFLNN